MYMQQRAIAQEVMQTTEKYFAKELSKRDRKIKKLKTAKADLEMRVDTIRQAFEGRPSSNHHMNSSQQLAPSNFESSQG